MQTRAVRVRELFALAVVTPSDAIDAFLTDQAGGDASLIAEVRALLAADAAARGWLNSSSLGEASASRRGTGSEDATEGELAPLPPGARLAHYRLDARIGAGGMGKVFRAWDLALGRPSAIKVVRPGFDQTLARRLLDEVEACARLQHPGIATFFEGGVDNGRVYFAMELVEGPTLRQRLHQGPILVEEALAVAAALLEALAHAHAADVLHRDIKPENIMLAAGGTPKLLDFGLARRLSVADVDDPREVDATTLSTLTAHGAIPGTPGYMSPEQLRGEPLTPASDLFQIGLVLYEALTGRRACGDGSILSRIAATLAGRPDLGPVEALGRRGLAALLNQALAPRAADRFATAGKFLLALDAVADRRLGSSLDDSLLVLDFTNTTGDPANDWLGSGISEGLRVRLGRANAHQVVSWPQRAGAASGTVPAASADPAEMGVKLGVRWVLAGTLERVRRDLRVAFRVVESVTARDLRAGWLEGTSDLIALQDQLIQVVSEALELRTAAEAPGGEDPRAYELYARARHLWCSDGRALSATTRLIGLLEEALRLAPDFTPALAIYGSVLASRFIATADPEDLRRGIEMTGRAIARDPANGEAWAWRAYALFRLDQLREAMEAWHHAADLDEADPRPLYFLGATHHALAEYEEGLRSLQQAVTLDPTFAMAWLALGSTLAALTQYEDARYAFGRAKVYEHQPGRSTIAGVGGYLADCLRCESQLARAREEALAGLESVERSDFAYRDTVRALCLGALGRVAILQGDGDAAAAAFSQGVAQMRGRSQTLGGGHVMVQAQAGLARATRDPALFSAAADLFERRHGYSFRFFFGCSDGFTLLELARTADALGKADDARTLVARARAAGCREAFRPPLP